MNMTLFWKLASLAALVMVIGLVLSMVVAPCDEALQHAYLRRKAKRELKTCSRDELLAEIDDRIAALQAGAALPRPDAARPKVPSGAPEDAERPPARVRWLQLYRRAVLDVSK